MKALAAPAEQRVAERPAHRAKGDGLDRGPVARPQAGPDMAFSDDHGLDQPLFGKGEDWLRVTLPIWAGAFHPAQEIEGHPARGDRGVDHQRVRVARGLDGPSQRLVQKGAKVVELRPRRR